MSRRRGWYGKSCASAFSSNGGTRPTASGSCSAFRELDAYAELERPLQQALEAAAYGERESALVAAVEALAARHNALGLTRQLDEKVRPFYSRPFLVLGSGRFVDACLERVSDERLRSLPLIGAVDQFADSTDVLSYPPVCRRAAELYGRLLER